MTSFRRRPRSKSANGSDELSRLRLLPPPGVAARARSGDQRLHGRVPSFGLRRASGVGIVESGRASTRTCRRCWSRMRWGQLRRDSTVHPWTGCWTSPSATTSTSAARMGVDACLVRVLNEDFFKGYEISRGNHLMADWLHHFPEYGRTGSKKLPRAWRSLKGWKRLAPPRARKPRSYPLVCAMAAQLTRRGR